MTFLIITFSAFFATLFIVTASTTVYMLKYVLYQQLKKQPKRDESTKFNKTVQNSTKVNKRRFEHSGSFEKLKTEVATSQTQTTKEATKSLQEQLDEFDQELNRSVAIEVCLQHLEYMNKKYPTENRILGMIGKAHQKIAIVTEDPSIRKYHIDKGIAACQASLDMNYNQSEVHKWMAVLISLKGETQTNREKIESGKLFKKHLDVALNLNPNDPFLQHLAGRFCYEISSLSWMEQKLANATFPEPLNCSYDKALEKFFQAEQRFNDSGWKENRLFIAKCYIAKKNYKDAVKWLRKAKATNDFSSTEKIDEEILTLLEQYSRYR